MKRTFVAQWGVYQMKSVSSPVETLYEDEKTFDSPSETGAKAQATRLLNDDCEVESLLASEWHPELFKLRLQDWEAPAPVRNQPDIMACYRRSQNEYKSQGLNEPSWTLWAFIRLYWKRPPADSE